MNWWYAKGEVKTGPLDDAAFHARVQDGTVQPGDMVWNETMATWKRAGSVPGLFAAPPLGCGGDGSTPNVELMRLARESLAGKWWLGIGAVVVLEMISQGVSFVGQLFLSIPLIGIIMLVPYLIAMIAVTSAIVWGTSRFFLSIARRENPEFGLVFQGFPNILKAAGTFFMLALYTGLWSLLFLVPGIIKGYSYAMTWYIRMDHPGMGVNEAIDRSMAMMDGCKWKLFCLNLRFLGWVLLGLLACCVGVYGVMPYILTAKAHFYEDVKGRCPPDQPPRPAF